MRRSLHLALVLCLVLTAIGLGAARGTVLLYGQVVLCTGEGVVVADHPDGRTAHLCPDMALSMLSTMPDGTENPALSRNAVDLDRPGPIPCAQGRESPRPAARGPPSWQISETKPV